MEKGEQVSLRQGEKPGCQVFALHYIDGRDAEQKQKETQAVLSENEPGHSRVGGRGLGKTLPDGKGREKSMKLYFNY